MHEDFDYAHYNDFTFRPCRAFRTSRSHPTSKFDSTSLILSKTVPASREKRWVPYYHFLILKNNINIGHINFRVGNTKEILEYDGHIGYEIKPKYRGFCAAYHATSLLLPFISEHGFESIVLTCHPDNIASIKTIERLGANFQYHREFLGIKNGDDEEKNIFTLNLYQQ